MEAMRKCMPACWHSPAPTMQASSPHNSPQINHCSQLQQRPRANNNADVHACMLALAPHKASNCSPHPGQEQAGM